MIDLDSVMNFARTYGQERWNGETEEAFLARLRASMTLAPVQGSRDELQAAYRELIYNRVAEGVYSAGLVLSTRGGWRFQVLRVCMWLIRKTGHEVIE